MNQFGVNTGSLSGQRWRAGAGILRRAQVPQQPQLPLLRRHSWSLQTVKLSPPDFLATANSPTQVHHVSWQTGFKL